LVYFAFKPNRFLHINKGEGNLRRELVRKKTFSHTHLNTLPNSAHTTGSPKKKKKKQKRATLRASLSSLLPSS